MRLGGPLFEKTDDPSQWIEALRRQDYGAAFCPLNTDADEAAIRAYQAAARKAGVVIAEVGAWSNPLSRDQTVREKALDSCKKSLALAERIGARCCVNISGSRGEKWDGPHADDLTSDTFNLIVQTVREIIDSVKPHNTFYTLETMPWMYPDSPDSYLRLIKAMDRKAFAVHLDPVNLICSPQRYFNNGDLVRDCFNKLGAYIKSCHAKDILLLGQLTTHLDEVRPGLGKLDYAVFLKELDKLDQDIPLMLEHLPDAQKYAQAAEYIRSVAQKEGIKIAS